MRLSLVPSKRLAITMHFLAKGNTYGDTGELFGTAASTVCGILHETVAALDKHLFQQHVQFPAGQELRQVVVDFERLVGLPQCGGAIDGCLIPMQAPTGLYREKYACYKGFPAVNLLAVCDANCIFTYVDVGHAGTVGDAAAFHRSDLKKALEDCLVFPMSHAQTIQGPYGGVIPVRPFLVGDSAFPFAPYLMKNILGDPLDHTDEHAYNYCHVRTRRVIENAFGRLKGRFRVLKGGKLNDPAWVTQIAKVCCALHNMCERYKSDYHDEWFPMQKDVMYKAGNLNDPEDNASAEESPNAHLVRTALARYVRCNNFY